MTNLIRGVNTTGFRRTITGTRDTDVVLAYTINPGDNRVVDLSEIQLTRIDADTFDMQYVTQLTTGIVRLDGFNPAVDRIRTTDGDFTIQEILDHGPNAPMHRLAQMVGANR